MSYRYVTKVSLDLVGPDGKACRRCGKATLMVRVQYRSLWVRPFEGGFGEVGRVAEIYCSGCDPEPKLTTAGAPIYEDELLEVVSRPATEGFKGVILTDF